jgi:hypothetical protein
MGPMPLGRRPTNYIQTVGIMGIYQDSNCSTPVMSLNVSCVARAGFVLPCPRTPMPLTSRLLPLPHTRFPPLPRTSFQTPHFPPPGQPCLQRRDWPWLWGCDSAAPLPPVPHTPLQLERLDHQHCLRWPPHWRLCQRTHWRLQP